MAEELDEFGIPIRKSTTSEVDEFGIPIKKKNSSIASPSGARTASTTSVPTGSFNPTKPFGSAQKSEREFIGDKAATAIERTPRPTFDFSKVKPIGGAEEVKRREQLVKKSIEKVEGKGTDVWNSLGASLNDMYEGLAKVPRYVYEAAAVPQNYIAKKLNPEAQDASYDDLLAMTNELNPGSISPLTMMDMIGDYYGGKSDQFKAKQIKYDDDIIGSIGKGNWSDAGSQIVNNIVASAPNMLLLAATDGAGGLGGLGAVSRTSVNALPFASSKANEIRDDETIPSTLKPMISALYGYSEVVFDQAFGTQAIVRRIQDQVINEGAEAAMNTGKKVIGGFVKKAFENIKQPVTDVGKNALDEMATQWTQNLIDRVTVDPEKDLMAGVIDAGIVGAVQGGGMGSVSAMIGKSKANIAKKTATINRLTADLDNPNLSISTREALEDNVDRLKSEVQKEIDDSNKEFETLDEKGKEEYLEKGAKVDAIEKSLADETLSEEAKTVLAEQKKVLDKELADIKPTELPITENTTSEPVVKETPAKRSKDTKIEVTRTRDGYEGDLLKDKEVIGEGSESTVYRDGDKVIKVTEPYNDDSTFDVRIKDAKLINDLVGDGSLEVIGHYESPNGTRNPIYEQNYVEGKPLSEKEVGEHLVSKGFTKTPNGYSIEKNGKTYEISDLSDNFFRNKDGEVVGIDASVTEITNAKPLPKAESVSTEKQETDEQVKDRIVKVGNTIVVDDSQFGKGKYEIKEVFKDGSISYAIDNDTWRVLYPSNDGTYSDQGGASVDILKDNRIENNNKKDEQTQPVAEPPSEQSSLPAKKNVEAPNVPVEKKAESVKDRKIEYTSRDGKKRSFNLAETELVEDEGTRHIPEQGDVKTVNLVAKDGNDIGNISFSVNDDGTAKIIYAGMDSPTLYKKGVGIFMYEQVAKFIKKNYGLDAVSGFELAQDTEKMWQNLVSQGKAEVVGDYGKDRNAYYYKYVGDGNTDITGTPSKNNASPESQRDMKNIAKNIGRREGVSKETVETIFESNDSLSSIGSKKEYTEYLNQVFPDTKLDGEYFHGTDSDFDKFTKNRLGKNSFDKGYYGQGLYFTIDASITDSYGNKQYVVLLNSQNPFTPNKENFAKLYSKLKDIGIPKVLFDRQDLYRMTQYKNEKYSDEITQALIELGFDSSISSAQVAIFNPDDIHIIGNKSDVEQFKAWKDNQPKAGDSIRKFADKVRQGKINKLGGFKASTGFDGAWDLGLEAVALSLDGGAKVADAIESGLKAIKQTDWYKSLADKKDFDDKYRAHMESEYEGEDSDTKSSSADVLFKLAHQNIESNEIRETFSNRERETGKELTQEEKDYNVQTMMDSLRHGVEIVNQAKQEFGKEYAISLLNFVRDNAKTLSVDKQSLILLSLENDLEQQLAQFPKDNTLKKQQKLVTDYLIKLQRSAARATAMGILRQLVRVGYDINQVTDTFFTPKQKEAKKKLESAIQSTSTDVQSQYESEEKVKAAIDAGVEQAVNEIYEAMPSALRVRADKAIAALDKIQKRLRSVAYDASIGVPVAIIDAGITTIKAAIKAGVSVTEAIELGIKKIKEQYGKEWKKEANFRKDMLDGFKREGVDMAPAKALSTSDAIKQSLIDAGYGKEITVTTKNGKEKRSILDWKKLTGEEGSLNRINEVIDLVLPKKDYTPEQIEAVKEGLKNEYNELHASIIEKAQNELDNRNKERTPAEVKSSARRLAELYNYGLFEKESDTYDKLVNSAIGLSDIGSDAFAEAKKIAQSMAKLYAQRDGNGQLLPEITFKKALSDLNNQIEALLTKVANKEATWKYKAVDAMGEFMGLSQRNALVSATQMVENTLSGFIERTFMDIGYRLSNNVDTKAMRKKRGMLAKAQVADIIYNAGDDFGEVTSPFLTKSKVMDKILDPKEISILGKKLDLSDSQVYHGTTAVLMGRAFLEGADSMHKVALTEKYFVYNLIKILRKKGMPKQEAVEFVSEKLTGQSFENAITQAKQLVEMVNEEAGKPLLSTKRDALLLLANDIVKNALLVGNQLTVKELEASKKAAYRSAGWGLGHEANNMLSEQITAANVKIQTDLKKAIKDKNWGEAVNIRLKSILMNNIMNPFVGGGTNWMFLTAEKAGINPLAWYRALRNVKDIDLTTDAGMRDLSNDLFMSMKRRNSAIRTLVGAGIGLSIYAASAAGDDEIEDLATWLKKNYWAQRYFDKIAPTSAMYIIARENDEMMKFFRGSLNVKDRDYFADGKKVYDVVNNRVKNDPQASNAALGDLIGGKVGTPIIPWRVIRDEENIRLGLNGLPPVQGGGKPTTFVNGLLKGGMFEYFGLRPKGDSGNNSENKSQKIDVR